MIRPDCRAREKQASGKKESAVRKAAKGEKWERKFWLSMMKSLL